MLLCLDIENCRNVIRLDRLITDGVSRKSLSIELFSLTHYRLSYYLLVAFVCACISGACKRVQSVVDNNKKRTAESAMLLKAALL